MTLEALRLKLVAAATGVDVAQVVFDYSNYLNHGSKTYPLALWDFNNLGGEGFMVAGEESDLRINCWFVTSVSPEEDVVKRHLIWDGLIADAKAYLDAVNGQDDVTIENIRKPPFEFFPAGLLSPEREMAVRYEIELKLWC
jgi:hypothetical protein